eukprot:Rmarinus@m.1188
MLLPPSIFIYIQMELGSSKTLADFLQESHRRLDPTALLKLFGQISEGVYHLHSHSVAHCDLKPANILYGEGGRVQITDFGLAKRLEGLSRYQSGDHSDGEHGTYLYTAPELQAGTSSTSDFRKADVYALGVILVEMFCPFTTAMERAHTLNKLLHSRSREDRKSVLPTSFLSDHPRVADLALRLLSNHPEERPTAMDLLICLTQLRYQQAWASSRLHCPRIGPLSFFPTKSRDLPQKPPISQNPGTTVPGPLNPSTYSPASLVSPTESGEVRLYVSELENLVRQQSHVNQALQEELYQLKKVLHQSGIVKVTPKPVVAAPPESTSRPGSPVPPPQLGQMLTNQSLPQISFVLSTPESHTSQLLEAEQ